MTHSKIKKTVEINLDCGGPPNSPPNMFRRAIKTMKQIEEVIKKSMTEKAKFPAGVEYIYGGVYDSA